MSVPFSKTVFHCCPFGKVRMERFLSSWAEDENVELISLQPAEAHARLVEHSCHMMIYCVGGASPSAHETLAEIQVLHTLGPKAPLVIVCDDACPASVIPAMNSSIQGYFSNSMDPNLALQALSFVFGGTYYPPTVLAGQAAGGTPVVEYTHHNFLLDVSSPSQFRSSAQQGQMSSSGCAEGPSRGKDQAGWVWRGRPSSLAAVPRAYVLAT